ncbi:DEKNAAC102580 [Brettanomyces naardenensis]|uniref:DEKNAAC102580 n=1 Tax=Brettanomyces naardenensis TaxID=13370 RepID=A0A448YKW1_BRENA|nr:DEKNAAC102580 [Brettanomyces naardenensis]
MSLVNLANVCCHLQNCTMARLPLAKVPYTRLHLQIALGLYNEGFVSSVQRGSINGPDITPVEVTPDNISTRRLWLGLKYRNNKPVLSHLRLISKPNRRVRLTNEELGHFASGKRVRFIPPMKPDEVVFLRTNKGEILNLYEAVKKQLDGELLCRAS